jgi:hypothetical protein
MLMALIFVYLSLISRSRPEKFRIQYYQKVKVLHYIFPEVALKFRIIKFLNISEEFRKYSGKLIQALLLASRYLTNQERQQ